SFLPPPRLTLFPYTTLFRSAALVRQQPRVPAARLRTGRALSLSDRDRARASRHAARAGAPAGGGERFRALCLLARHAATLELGRSEEHTSELQSRGHLVCRL